MLSPNYASGSLTPYQIQKGVLQLCKGLTFLHNSAKLIHSNICPESIILNAAVRQNTMAEGWSV